MRVNKKWLYITIILFIVEILIALYVKDQIIRPYGGDFLVVILIFGFFRSFLKSSSTKIALWVFLFAAVIETLQYFNFIVRIGLSNSEIARVIFGNTFSWHDLLVYFLGLIAALLIDKFTRPIQIPI
ncbi:MAG: hypothetical protein ACI959_001296 [Limisphaerales bacterium]|jgi:hypothetical protein